ncbi:LysE family transporter [Candidatus Bathyarchaeota archaeon]|nr:LysE family transporter [Candidatus Bathyarchaeota archaeon]
MITVEFLATVVLVSVSGVLGPGPLFLASTLRATKIGSLSGLQCAIGHTIVEAPLVFGLALGLSALLNPTTVKLIGILGGSVLLIFAAVQFLQASHKVDVDSKKLPDLWERRPGIVLGIVFTALNPFFILWWLTVGSALISEAILLGAFGGVAVMFASHIWMDYAWLGGTAAVAGRGTLFLGHWFRILLVVFGAAMAYFGVTFILSALQ